MKRRQNRIFLVAAAALLLAMTGPSLAVPGKCPWRVRASQTVRENQETQSLAEFRKLVAVSICETADWISKEVIAHAGGSAGGRLLLTPEDGEDKEKEQTRAGEQASQKSISKEKAPYDPYNVYDYDSADAFADDYAEEFAEEFFDDETMEDAYEDGYDEACDYWESRHR